MQFRLLFNFLAKIVFFLKFLFLYNLQLICVIGFNCFKIFFVFIVNLSVEFILPASLFVSPSSFTLVEFMLKRLGEDSSLLSCHRILKFSIAYVSMCALFSANKLLFSLSKNIILLMIKSILCLKFDFHFKVIVSALG